jgi:hypothetical protein
VRWYIESNNLVFLIILVKLVAAVALIAVYNKQMVHTNSLVLYMRVKVL